MTPFPAARLPTADTEPRRMDTPPHFPSFSFFLLKTRHQVSPNPSTRTQGPTLWTLDSAPEPAIYPFTPPIVIPRRKYRWKARKTTSIGSAI